MTRTLARSVFLALAALAGCSPALDWRQVREPAVPLQVAFPCKPQRVAQPDMGLLQCEAADLRFVLGWKTETEPERLRSALSQQAQQLGQRAHGTAEPWPGADLPHGALAWPGAGRFRVAGAEQTVWLQVWAQGMTLVQALVIANGQSPAGEEPARQFLASVEALP